MSNYRGKNGTNKSVPNQNCRIIEVVELSRVELSRDDCSNFEQILLKTTEQILLKETERNLLKIFVKIPLLKKFEQTQQIKKFELTLPNILS